MDSEAMFSNRIQHIDTLVLSDQYIHQLYADNGCRLEDLLSAMADWDGWHGRVKEPVLSARFDYDVYSNF